jgi:ABC-type dipeptide/oligopeptide/nickel transport system ATPase component
VFSGIVHGNQIWTPDPFDVDTIHVEAREAFARLLNRASSSELPPHGKTLLLLGEGGSGKTHLMRAFRTAAHAVGGGYCGYLQMTSKTDNYTRYILSNLIDSLEQPYKPNHSETGLTRLARGLLDSLDIIPIEDRQRLCDDLLEPDELARLVHRFADLAVQYPRFRGIDINLIRAMLYTLPNDGRIHPRILNWLRCEDLNRYDRELIGDLIPRPQPEMPLKTILDLGRLMHAVHSAAFVLLVDQLEEMVDLDRNSEARGEQFRSAINALVDVADGLPNAVVVIGCLDDLFVQGQAFLSNTKLDRLCHDPAPITLSARRTTDEIQAIIARRLEIFFETVGVEFHPDDPLVPYKAEELSQLAGLRSRDVLNQCLQHRLQCVAENKLLPFLTPPPPPPSQPPQLKWEQCWNDFHSAFKLSVLDDETALAQLLADTIRIVSAEMSNGVYFGADPEGRFVPVEVHGAENAVDKLLVAVCDKKTQGGGFSKQVQEVAKKAGEIPAVIVRSTDFPNNPRLVVSREIANLIMPKGKGRKVVVANADWRAMAAFREFHRKYSKEPYFAEWQRAERPLSELRAVHDILNLDHYGGKIGNPRVERDKPISPPPPTGTTKIVPPPPPPESRLPRTTNALIRLGQTRGQVPQPIDLRPADFCRHAAFLGGSGSGKTTAALAVIENLLLQGVPAVLIDRKGDLARYADPTAWTAPEPDPDRAARRDSLRAAVDVALYTPGNDHGRPLAIPVVPTDLGQLPAADREQLAQFAATSLGMMLGYRSKTPDPKLVILQKAIEVLSEHPGQTVTVKALQELVKNQDDALVYAVDGFEAKHYNRLATDLLTLSHQHRRLFEGKDVLDVDALLGRGLHAVSGKTRLTIINTQSLGDPSTTDFWVSQFLLAVDRWRGRNPASDGVLQAVFFFDEADLYLPAGTSRPAAKGPMENLLKRARSAGIGLFLATQSPGDFDYKCRDQILTWLIGRVREPVAISKLKTMLESRSGATDRLADQAAGQFYLVRESDVSPVTVVRNLIPTEQLPEDQIIALARQCRE